MISENTQSKPLDKTTVSSGALLKALGMYLPYKIKAYYIVSRVINSPK